jgi:hypothetical protein
VPSTSLTSHNCQLDIAIPFFGLLKHERKDALSFLEEYTMATDAHSGRLIMFV